MSNLELLRISQDGDIERPGIEYSDGVLVKCRRCAVELGDHYYSECPTCGHSEPPICLCRKCGGQLVEARARLTACGSEGVTATRCVDGLKCKTCGTTAVFGFLLGHLSDAAHMAGEPIELCEEQGVFGARQIEIFSPFDTSAIEHEVSVSLNGITAITGPKSDLFAATTPHISELDNGLISYMDALRIVPGPPYSPEQRASIEVLLATLRIEVGSELRGYDEEGRNAIKRVIGQLAVWTADPERVGVSLCNAILSGDPPGSLMNTFRLLEVVLDRWWRAQVVKKRTDNSIKDSEFLLLVSDFPRKKFDERLIARLDALSSIPTEILKRLAILLCGRASTKPKGVLRAVADFRNSHAHGPIPGRSLPLPWEHPKYHACEVELIRLVGYLLDDDGVEPSLPLAIKNLVDSE